MPLFLRPYALASTVPVEWSKAESPQLARGEGGVPYRYFRQEDTGRARYSMMGGKE